MDAIGLTEYLLKDIREKKDALTHSLAVGAVDNIETSRLTVGQIRGLQYCEDEIKSAMKGVLYND